MVNRQRELTPQSPLFSTAGDRQDEPQASVVSVSVTVWFPGRKTSLPELEFIGVRNGPES